MVELKKNKYTVYFINIPLIFTDVELVIYILAY
jgi:hypothetical protein